MQVINSFSLGLELKFLFDKYYFLNVNEFDFNDHKVYENALIIFQYLFSPSMPH